MREEDIGKMNFKELREEVQLLRDELAIFGRKYEDAINNLDSDNFGKSFTAEQNGMKTQIRLTAEGLKSTVSKTDLATELIGYSTIEQTAEAIRLGVANGVEGINSTINQLTDQIALVVASSDGKSVIDSASIIAAINEDTSSVSIKASKIDLTSYAKASEVYDVAESAAEDVLYGITLTATNGETSSAIKIKYNGVEIDSATVRFTGVVTFSDLSTEGSTTIHGGNIEANSLSVKCLASDGINDSGEYVVEFDKMIAVEKISGVSHLYFWGASLIANYEDFGDLIFSSPSGYVFQSYAPVVQYGKNYYEVITEYNIDDYIGDTTAVFG